ncbi:YdbL family protein [Limibaculum sp. M0105]|uniref:YdbL family protein n=1 Tax=Thermohalobaculum xanthum TaxID=2753746 RepID=A0A8J7SFF9_9RHOB|nr:YdbL family protein [Thermohalobaculum xanthum]MBK0398420.1 YdbL family protein [Thermohalobaculum xanthum]
MAHLIRCFRRVAAVLTVALIMLASETPDAWAQSKLDSYRANGAVAERFDGYVEVRDPGAPGDARALVNEVNAQRRALYEKRAKETNVPVAEVGKLFATKIVEQAPKGTYFRQPSGSYVRK